MKKAYISPKADFVTFQVEDVITVSGNTTTTTASVDVNAADLNRDIEYI